MEDALLKQIQSWTNNVPLIILGSGGSVPFKLPSMWSLGNFIKTNCKFINADDKDQFEVFKAAFDRNGDLEQTLSEIHLRVEVLREIVHQTWQLINKTDLEAFDDILEKNIQFPLSALLEYLLGTAAKKVSIVTTNYDRLAEYAASLAKAVVCTGYAQNYVGHFSSAIPTNLPLSGYKGQINIWKVHGSLDWFKTDEDQDVHLPLRHSIPKNYYPLIVTPGLSKYLETHNEPYRTIFSQADIEIEKANGYLCIGYGFNDIHVQPKLINQIKSNKPIIVITKEISPKTKQAIIENKCKHYVLLEQHGTTDTKIYSSLIGEQILSNRNFWQIGEFLKLIKS